MTDTLLTHHPTQCYRGIDPTWGICICPTGWPRSATEVKLSVGDSAMKPRASGIPRDIGNLLQSYQPGKLSLVCPVTLDPHENPAVCRYCKPW